MRSNQFLVVPDRKARVSGHQPPKLRAGTLVGGRVWWLGNRGLAISALAVLVWLVGGQGWVFAADPDIMKIEALLVWGTNDGKSPQPSHTPITGGEIWHKLQGLPLRWTNYFVVNRKVLEIHPKIANKVVMSDKCEVEVRSTGNDKVEVSLLSKREPVVKRTQAMPKDETLILGGNAPNATAWLLVLRRTQ